ncbi:MAG: S-formylglutathione hydrolase [Rhodospirillaceae bacterium]|nr:S-formylglutathione hydrolase [Rhodospirillaceae bacterium]
MQIKSDWASFGGRQRVYEHDSTELGCAMEVAVYTPPQAEAGPVPVLTYLSGLTCTWENVTTKAGFQAYAAEHGVIVVCPDTSPRGDDVPDAADEYDFGKGAGFYVNATQAQWAKNYRMYAYIVDELPGLIAGAVDGADLGRQGIFGHSMGGHGALTIAFKNQDTYKSISAFAPIVAPMEVPWGHKALGRYLGDDRAAWADYDACTLLRDRGWHGDILIDQGEADDFLEEQLRPALFLAACDEAGVDVQLRLQPGYDHSYYFIASFMRDHIAWHAARM